MARAARTVAMMLALLSSGAAGAAPSLPAVDGGGRGAPPGAPPPPPAAAGGAAGPPIDRTRASLERTPPTEEPADPSTPHGDPDALRYLLAAEGELAGTIDTASL